MKTKTNERRTLAIGQRLRVKGRSPDNIVEIVGNPEFDYVRVKYVLTSETNKQMLGTVRRIYRRCLTLYE